MAPVVRALSLHYQIRQHIVLTGQHRGLADAFAGLSVHQLDFDLRSKSIAEICDGLRGEVARFLKDDPPDLVIVHGDTTSAYAGALAAKDCGIAVAHVEAGLRSFDINRPWPEEGNRIAIDAIADLLFAPTEVAATNLAIEPEVTGTIHVTGNSGIDALLQAARGADYPGRRSSRKTIIVTCHRRENQGEALARICETLKKLVEQFPVRIAYIMHPNRHIRAAVEARLRGVAHIDLLEPMDHADMVRQILDCWIILTDSGGLQEEGPALGKPVLVLRDVTERVEAPANVELVGTRPAAIIAGVNRLLMNDTYYARMAQPAMPFGDGQAAPRIAMLIEQWLARS
jgi:UDP-N-acetylglucosamine 2-epimerase (non-hydrolysing)